MDHRADRSGVGSDVGSVGITGVMTGQEYAVMWGVCGSLGGQVRSRQCCGECGITGRTGQE